MFSRCVIARCGPLAGVPHNTSASFRGKTLWGCGLLYAVFSTHSNWDHCKRTRAETSAVLFHTVRTCIYPRLHS